MTLSVTVSTRSTDLIISKTVDLMGFSPTTIAQVYTNKQREEEKMFKEWQVSGLKDFINVNDKWRKDRQVPD